MATWYTSTRKTYELHFLQYTSSSIDFCRTFPFYIIYNICKRNFFIFLIKHISDRIPVYFSLCIKTIPKIEKNMRWQLRSVSTGTITEFKSQIGGQVSGIRAQREPIIVTPLGSSGLRFLTWTLDRYFIRAQGNSIITLDLIA